MLLPGCLGCCGEVRASCDLSCPPAAHPLLPGVQVRACLIEEAKKRFKRVKQVPLSAVPKQLRLEYVDIWELTQPKPAAAGPAG